MTYEEQYRVYLESAERAIRAELSRLEGGSERLRDAMAYSLTAGGKRVRPVFLLASAEASGVGAEAAAPFAAAIEAVHTYSLIHDDLPAMDDDDYRRGKPSCHRAFGEATAILAGDALLNLAYEIALREVTDENRRRAGAILAAAAGYFGMVSGQEFDLESEGKGGEAELVAVQSLKTGRLLEAALLMGDALGGGKNADALGKYGAAVGRLFQTADDILDATSTLSELGKSVGKDAAQGKLTAVTLWGLEGARRRAEEFFGECAAAAAALGESGKFFSEYAKRLLIRIMAEKR